MLLLEMNLRPHLVCRNVKNNSYLGAFALQCKPLCLRAAPETNWQRLSEFINHLFIARVLLFSLPQVFTSQQDDLLIGYLRWAWISREYRLTTQRHHLMKSYFLLGNVSVNRHLENYNKGQFNLPGSGTPVIPLR